MRKPDDIAGEPGSEDADEAADAAVEQPEGADGGEDAGDDEGQTDRERAIRAEAELAAMQKLVERYGLAGGDDVPPTQPGPQAAIDEFREDLDELEDLIANARVLASRGDKTAKLQLVMLQREQRNLNGFVKALSLQQEQIVELGVPTDRRDAFKTFLQEHGGAFKSRGAAKKVFLATQAVAADTTTPTTTPTSRTPRRPVVDTTVRPVPSREARARVMTGQQWDDAMASMSTAERIDLQRKFDAGELVVND